MQISKYTWNRRNQAEIRLNTLNAIIHLNCFSLPVSHFQLLEKEKKANATRVIYFHFVILSLSILF